MSFVETKFHFKDTLTVSQSDNTGSTSTSSRSFVQEKLNEHAKQVLGEEEFDLGHSPKQELEPTTSSTNTNNSSASETTDNTKCKQTPKLGGQTSSTKQQGTVTWSHSSPPIFTPISDLLSTTSTSVVGVLCLMLIMSIIIIRLLEINHLEFLYLVENTLLV